MAADELIRLESVTKEYKSGDVVTKALRGLDLTIPRGEVAVLIGPSGCGKTTTLNLVGGLDQATAGHVVVDGQDLAAYDEGRLIQYRRHKVGFVFQFFNLIPTLSALENIEFAANLTRRGASARRQSLELLEKVGLKERADHFPAQLSGGEQQRVAIARSLANDPVVLLCDEPTGNLDEDIGRQVLGVIREMNRSRGTTVLLVTHNTAIAPMADRIVRLRNGKVDSAQPVAEPKAVSELSW
jgi:putative ABC transport system ATP-binding protein